MTLDSLAPIAAPVGPLPTYDWNYPVIIQNHDWDCCEESIRWCLHAYGRRPDDTWMEQSMMAAGVVNPEVGCTDASGAGLARWVNDQYGEYGYLASNNPRVSFDEVAEEAASHEHPLAIGGREWYHWSAVRGYDELGGRLLLANPAPGWKGVYQTLDRDQWARFGLWSLVRVTHPAAEAGGDLPVALPSGIDVSSHQGRVNWTQVRQSGVAFSFTKATGGAWYTNPTLEANWSGMKAASIQRGAYHFAFETSGQPLPGPGPEAEAQYFLDRVLPLGLDRGDMLVLDMEQGAGNLPQWALRWLKYVEAKVGFKPMFYSANWFTSQHNFAAVPELASYPLWQADYRGTMPPPIAPWTKIDFWQYTDKATVPGVATLVDANRFNGPPEALLNYGKPGTIPPNNPYAPWAGLVGTGLIEMMSHDKTLPAQRRSTWLPLGDPPPSDIEECVGENGVVYRWLIRRNLGFRYPPL